jgi:hypothetical protein
VKGSKWGSKMYLGYSMTNINKISS